MSFKKLSVLFILISAFVAYSFSSRLHNTVQNTSSSRDIALQFITYNGYGNNLYIDNVLTGERISNDVAVTSIINFPIDSVYSIYTSGTDTVAPILSVANIGLSNSSDSITVHMKIDPGNYLRDTLVRGLAPGQTAFVTFPEFEYTIGTRYYIKAFVTDSLDSNNTNDTLNQSAISLPGYRRNVLYEEFSSNSSPACANNNTFLNSFTNTNIQTVNSIVYHTGILGNDTFYTFNPVQNDARKNYYYLVGVPTTFVDGVLITAIPYGDSINLYTPYNTRYNTGTPVSLTVSDQIIGDSVHCIIDLNVLSPVPKGDYRLRINAIERYRTDITAANGENQFYDIFREMYPDTNGISILLNPGSQQFTYTYFKNPEWIDSVLYTTVFIQDNLDREILNSAKSREIVINKKRPEPVLAVSNKSDLFQIGTEMQNYYPPVTGFDSVFSDLNIELFEAAFPPLGWKVFNRDGFITFKQFSGANGPTIGGVQSVYMNFFNYNIIGQKDSMYSKVYEMLVQDDSVEFDYAYAQYNNFNIDSLIVKISTDGGLTFPTEIFRKGGLQLTTAPQTSSGFVPQNNSEWNRFSYPLQDIVSVNNFSENIPNRFSLDQNFPNPFNPETKINFELPVSGNVSIKIYDITGREIFTLLQEFRAAGKYSVTFNPQGKGLSLSSGVYFYRLNTQGFTDTKRMVLIK